VGATTAFTGLSATLEVALVDVEEKATGLALDIGQSLSYTGSGSKLTGAPTRAS
jgi:malate/lactate dehydrogenase